MPRSVVAVVVVAVAAVGVAGIAGIAAGLWINTRRPRVPLPHPKPDAFLGNTLLVVRNAHRLNEFFHDLDVELGPNYAMIPTDATGRASIIITSDPAIVEHILRTNFENYIKADGLHFALSPLLGDGIFVTNGEQWRWQRKTSSHIFTGKMFREVVERVVLEDLDRLIAFCGAVADDGKEIDLHAVLHTFTLDSFAKIGFGVDLHGLDNPEVKPDFAQAFDSMTQILAWRFYNPLWPITEHIYGQRRQLRKDKELIDRFAHECIERKRREIEDGIVAPSSRKDLLDLFMATANEDGQKLSDIQLRDMVLNMILAGRDTTAQALSWCFLELSRHPEIVTKMRDELSTVLDDRVPGFDEISRLKYINAVFLESQRLHPSVPSNIKSAVNDDVLPGGIAIPKGCEVSWSNYSMGRSKRIWGDDALVFNPDRWMDEDGNIRRISPYRFPAFNAGPRVCLGQQMATVEGVQVLAGLTREFEFVRVGGDAQDDPGHAVAITLMMEKPGLRMFVKRRVRSSDT